MKSAIFCGTFDPFTLGHLDILEQAGLIFDKVFVAVPNVCGKLGTSSLEERIKIVKASIQDCSFAEVVSFSGALTDFCRAMGQSYLIRGIRNTADLMYENDLIYNYQTQDPSIKCVYFLPSKGLSHISSSVVRELVRVDGNIKNHVHKNAINLAKECYKQ